jgi:hypothetical protein
MQDVYRVEFYCPRLDDSWHQDPQNPFWILGNAIQRCKNLLYEVHAARVVDSQGRIYYQI